MSVVNIILKNKIIAILRGANPSDALKIIQSLGEGGIILAEVTMNSAGALKVIEEANKKPGDKLIIGAGTVLDAATARDAISAGAKFIISPSVNTEVIEMTKKYGAVSIPGAFTATEIVTAWSAGGDIIKVFPVPGIQYIKDIRGPLSHIPLMPTGGVNLENILAFFKAGAVAAGIGSALVDTKQKITAEYLQAIKNKAEKFVEAVTNI